MAIEYLATGRIYVPDTNVLINDPDSIKKLATGNTVVVPHQVVCELDRLKTKLNGVGSAARGVTKWLDEVQQEHDWSGAVRPIAMGDGGCLVFDDNRAHADDVWDGFDATNADDQILRVARKWRRM